MTEMVMRKLKSHRGQGYRQWTDLALLWHSMEKGASFVTFDQGLKQAAGWTVNALVLKY